MESNTGEGGGGGEGEGGGGGGGGGEREIWHSQIANERLFEDKEKSPPCLKTIQTRFIEFVCA